MGNELSLGDLYLGPIRGSQSAKLGVVEAPVDAKQTMLRCVNCLNIYTAKDDVCCRSRTPSPFETKVGVSVR